jgi:hypothetical protein
VFLLKHFFDGGGKLPLHIFFRVRVDAHIVPHALCINPDAFDFMAEGMIFFGGVGDFVLVIYNALCLDLNLLSHGTDQIHRGSFCINVQHLSWLKRDFPVNFLSLTQKTECHQAD